MAEMPGPAPDEDAPTFRFKDLLASYYMSMVPKTRKRRTAHHLTQVVNDGYAPTE